MDINSLAHTKWNCKYHIVFAPKYRRKVAYGKMKQDIANILSMLCKRKSVEIVEAEICPDHVHMLVTWLLVCFFLFQLDHSAKISSRMAVASSMQPGQDLKTFPVSIPFRSLHFVALFFS